MGKQPDYLLFHITGMYLFSPSYELEKHIPLSETSLELLSQTLATIDEPNDFEDLIKGLPEFETITKDSDYILLNPYTQAYPIRLFKQVKNQTQETIQTIATITRERIAQSITPDHYIIQAIACYHEQEHAIERFTARIRDFLKLYDPEQVQTKTKPEEIASLVQEVTSTETASQQKTRMGGYFATEDYTYLAILGKQLTQELKNQEQTVQYLTKRLKNIAPNVLSVAGPLITATLLRKSGGLRRLSLMPASTIQVLGAEKALFRHLRSRARSPKYGILYVHPLVQETPDRHRGKIARFIADQLSIATKVDYYNGEFIGDTLQKKIETKVAKFQNKK